MNASLEETPVTLDLRAGCLAAGSCLRKAARRGK